VRPRGPGRLLVVGPIAVCLAVAAGCTAATPGPASTTPATSTTSAPTPTTSAISTASTTSTTTDTTHTTPATSTTSHPVPDGVVLGNIVADLIAGGPREAGTPAEHAALDLVTGALRDLGLVTEEEEVPLPNGRTSRNVWATVGSGPRHVLLGAHIDSVRGSPGADDNASGVALLLHLAGELAADPPSVRVTIVAFGAEEVLHGHARDIHHLGSRRMAARLAAEGTLPDLMVSVDMVGVGTRLLAVRYRDSDPTARDLLVAAGDAADVAITADSRGDISDHEAFARRGVPAAMLWRPDNPAYHGPDDVVVDVALLEDGLALLRAFIALAMST